MNTPEEFEKELQRVEGEIRVLELRKVLLQKKLSEFRSGCALGDVIEYQGEAHLVVDFDSFFPIAVKRKKDGTFGVARRYIYHPERVKILKKASD